MHLTMKNYSTKERQKGREKDGRKYWFNLFSINTISILKESIKKSVSALHQSGQEALSPLDQ